MVHIKFNLVQIEPILTNVSHVESTQLLPTEIEHIQMHLQTKFWML